MITRKEYTLKQNWFKNNLVAIPAGIVGNCDGCVFRDLPNYCAKMLCTYFDKDGDFIENVYWRAMKDCPDVVARADLVNWFKTTPSRIIMSISSEITRQAILGKIQKAQ